MKQRGRKSAAELAVAPAAGLRLLAPPADFSDTEAAVWASVVGTKPGDWWDAGTLPLLAQYCRAAAQSDVVAALVSGVLASLQADPDELERYRELRKIQSGLSSEMNSLATKMRLTQQSRYNAKNSDTAARRAGVSARRPWHHDVIEV